MPRLDSGREYEMVICFLDMEKSTEIALGLGKHWVNFLGTYYRIAEQLIEFFEQYGARRHKFIGDGILLKFHPQLAVAHAPTPGLPEMTNYAFDFVLGFNNKMREWIEKARGQETPWINLLDDVLLGRPLMITTSLATGPIIPFDEPDRSDRPGQRREIAGVTIHRAQRLTKVHDLLPNNNIFITDQCYQQLLPTKQSLFSNITDLMLKGFPQPERVYSGSL